LSNYMLRTVPFLWHNCLEELLDIFSVDEESTCDLLELLTVLSVISNFFLSLQFSFRFFEKISIKEP
jgi:hypothetical protein